MAGEIRKEGVDRSHEGGPEESGSSAEEKRTREGRRTELQVIKRRLNAGCLILSFKSLVLLL